MRDSGSAPDKGPLTRKSSHATQLAIEARAHIVRKEFIGSAGGSRTVVPALIDKLIDFAEREKREKR
jgi:hypothetical protein